MSLACHQTIVKNVSGGTVWLGYLPPYGSLLANAATFAWNGDIEAAILKYQGQIALDAFWNDILNGVITLVQTPQAIAIDSASPHASYGFGVTSTAPAAIVPCS